MSVKYTCILPDKVNNMLEKISKDSGDTKASIIRKALYLYDKLYTELSNKSNKLYIIDEDNNNNTKELLIVGVVNDWLNK